MVEFLFEQVIELSLSLTDSVRNVNSNKDMSSALLRRIQVINSTLPSLKGNPDVSPEALSALISTLEQAVVVVNRIKAHWRLARVWYAKKDSEDLSQMDERIGQCISDLMLPLNLSTASLARQGSIRAQTRTFEAALTCEEAKYFWTQYYEGKFAVEWRYFWACFVHELDQLAIEPSRGLEEEVKGTVDFDQNLLVDVTELNRFFTLWREPDKQSVLIQLGTEHDTICKALDNSSSYSKQLKLEVLSVNDNHPNELKVGMLLVIAYAGLVGSKRGRADRVVKFGRFDPDKSPNDVQFSASDTEVEVNHFQIISQGSGFCLYDAFGIGGTCTKIEPECAVCLEAGMIFNIGGNAFLRVTEITTRVEENDEPVEETIGGIASSSYSDTPTQSSIKLEVIKGELRGTCFEFDSLVCPEVEIGRKDSARGPKPIEFVRDSLVSRSHARLVFSGGSWRLQDLNSRNGTWLSILNYARLAAQESSEALRLIPGMVFAASRYWFRVLDA
jgi:hypothetical protein